VGSNAHEVLTYPQDVHSQGLFQAPHTDPAMQHGRTTRVRPTKYLQHFGYGQDDNTNNANTVITQTTAAATMGTMLGNTYANTTTSTIPAEVTAAISQLLANQMVIMQQMVMMSFSPPLSIAVPAFNITPIQSVTIPNQNLFNTGGSNQNARNVPGGG
jgi:hypothetical protein